jgi:hypothetical protein
MYLEMYPQLTEMDPSLWSSCDSNPAAARGIISALLADIGA